MRSIRTVCLAGLLLVAGLLLAQEPCWYSNFNCWHCGVNICWSPGQGDTMVPGTITNYWCHGIYWADCMIEENCFIYDVIIWSECPDGSTWEWDYYLCCQIPW